MKTMLSLLLFGFIWISVSHAFLGSDELRLHQHLLNRSEESLHVRPVFNTSETVRVNFGMALIQIYGLDEVKQVLDLHVWLRFLWKDITLRWSPVDFGGVDHTRIPYSKIWKPDIILYNSAYENYNSLGLGNKMDAMAVVSSDGTVLWIPVARTKSSCSIDITFFPFDEQTCVLKFGSWTYDGFKLDINFYDGIEQIDVSDYIESNMWGLTGHPAIKNVKYYPCCQEPYPDLTFTLKLKRITSFYTFTLVIPGVVMSLLIPAVFLLPVGRPEKFTLGCTILICLTLLTLLIEMQVPNAHSGVPLIDIFYVYNILFTGLSLVLSAIVLNISKIKKEPPYFLKKFIDCLGKVCCLQTSGANYRNFKVTMSNNADDGNNPIVVDPDSSNISPYQSDWLTVAIVLDRIFLICFFVVLILGALSILA